MLTILCSSCTVRGKANLKEISKWQKNTAQTAKVRSRPLVDILTFLLHSLLASLCVIISISICGVVFCLNIFTCSTELNDLKQSNNSIYLIMLQQFF